MKKWSKNFYNQIVNYKDTESAIDNSHKWLSNLSKLENVLTRNWRQVLSSHNNG